MQNCSKNRLRNQTSPYLLQHADNPVDWYPWCDEAFQRARTEDKPIFLSIGYSTCHWCHVMAHESFEDEQIAEILNQYFISIKVDKEERPDIDSIYMAVCQAFTGSGGWPTTVFLTPEQKPFYAGTYFPKTSRYGQPGLGDLLMAIHEGWTSNRKALLKSAEEVIALLDKESASEGNVDARLITRAVEYYKRAFDREFGGFGKAPKFPTPHNLLFLMRYYENSGDEEAMDMAEKTLLQMYRGGMFDHIGGGFSRYSTDRYFLAPHFEKMLYDNALLILAYSKAYQLTGKPLYREVAEKTAGYVLREMTSPEGGFYSAQDADSEGVEGKYYLFEPAEIIGILGEQAGEEFNRYFDITEKGNFEGKNIPNLLRNRVAEEQMKVCVGKQTNGGQMGSRVDEQTNGGQTGSRVDEQTNGGQMGSHVHDRPSDTQTGDEPMRGGLMSDERMKECLSAVYNYRKNRYDLHLDDKILTGWNGLMIAAMCHLYRVTENEAYLNAAVKAQSFIQNQLCENDTLHISFREGKRSGKGFLDDYANDIFALLSLYEATLDGDYLKKARRFCEKAVADFFDEKQGGFFLYGKENEQLILRPKETYDGAVPSGNSVMAWNLVQLSLLTGEECYGQLAERQLKFMSGEAEGYPTGYAMFLMALSDYLDTPDKVTIVLKDGQKPAGLACRLPLNMLICVLDEPTEEYPLKNDRTTYYVCRGRSCQPPVNVL